MKPNDDLFRAKFPDELVIFGWDPLGYPLSESSMIQVGIRRPTQNQSRWRPDDFTVYTLPFVDRLKKENRELLALVKDFEAYLSSDKFEDGLPPGAPYIERVMHVIAKAEGTSSKGDGNDQRASD